MVISELLYRYLPLTLLALSPVFVSLYLTRKKRRPEVNQAMVIILLAIIGGLLMRGLLGILFSLFQLSMIF